MTNTEFLTKAFEIQIGQYIKDAQTKTELLRLWLKMSASKEKEIQK